MATKTRRIETGPLFREARFDTRSVSAETRTVELAFSSEEPVERWFGKEILDHAPGSVRLGRLRNAAPVLVDHNHRDQVGVVESVKIDGDRVGRATVRFGKSARAEEIFQDIQDGIRQKVSVGYRIHRLRLEEESDEGDTYRVLDWEPYEISIVSVPADDGVGVGRAAEEATNECLIERIPAMDVDDKKTPDVNPETRNTPAINVEGERRAAAEAERDRVQRILSLARENNQMELAEKFISQGRRAEDFEDVLAVIADQAPVTRDQPVSPIDLGMSAREDQEYSLLRALRHAAFGDEAGLEREISDTIAKQLGRSTDGIFVPTSLNVRAPLTAGGAGTGAETVPTQLMPLIELLRNRMMVKRLGARVLSGLHGNLQFPRQIGSTTLHWVGENPGTDVPESNATFDQVDMMPKSAQATTAYSRQMLAQSSLDVENFVRDDLAKVNALGLDWAAINGTGTNFQPLGIRNTTGVGLVSLGANGGPLSFGVMVDLETDIAIDNADVDNMAYLTNAKVRGALKQTEKTPNSGQFVWADSTERGFGSVNGYRAAASNQVPGNLTKGTGTGLSSVIFGNWSDLMIGEWGVMELILDPYSKKKQALVEVTSIMLVDIAVRHPESFAIIEDAAA